LEREFVASSEKQMLIPKRILILVINGILCGWMFSAPENQVLRWPPTAPADFNAAARSSSEIDLTWQDDSPNELGFKIERRSPGNPFSVIAFVRRNVTSYIDVELPQAAEFEYRIRAFNAWGESPPSKICRAYTDYPEINGSLKGEAGNIQDNVFQSLAIDPTDSRIVYVGTETNGIFKTIDGGDTWTRLRAGLKLDPNKSGYPQIYEIAVDPRNTRILYAATIAAPGPVTGGIEALRSNYAGVYKSTDRGERWIQKIDGFFNTYTPHVVIDPLDSSRLYAGIGGARSMNIFYEGGMMKSLDGATTWISIPAAPGTSTNTPISMSMTEKNSLRTLYVSYMIHGTDVSTTFGMYKSADDGATWVPINPPGTTVQYFDVYAGDNAVIYGNDTVMKRLFKSLDGGGTWRQLPLGNYGPVKISPINPNTVFYTGFTTLFKSTDGLITSKVVLDDTQFLGTRQFMDIKISASDPHVVWAAAKGYYLYKSVDSGESFARITAVRDLVYGTAH